VRDWFDRRDFTEVRTNALAVAPGFDAYSRPFRTRFESADGTGRDLHLVTSPEFEMKGLLSNGLAPIWQIARSFRNSDRDATHLPEFDMLEWYRKNADYRTTMRDTEDLVRDAVRSVDPSGRSSRAGFVTDLNRPFERIPLPDLFLERTGLDLVRLQDTAAFREAVLGAGFGPVPEDATWDNIFFIVFLSRVEPELLAMDRAVFLYDHPVQVFSLARQKPGRPEFVERFECYATGLELCNGYTELDDWNEHLRRFSRLSEVCRLRGLPPPVFPSNLEGFIKAGLGLCSGVALGIERLAMIALSKNDIREVVPFDIFSA
jgi:lysyl-tRNA synthetase class 2